MAFKKAAEKIAAAIGTTPVSLAALQPVVDANGKPTGQARPVMLVLHADGTLRRGSNAAGWSAPMADAVYGWTFTTQRAADAARKSPRSVYGQTHGIVALAAIPPRYRYNGLESALLGNLDGKDERGEPATVAREIDDASIQLLLARIRR
jgi:hypothetical protein